MGIATTTLSATTRQLSDQNSQGTVLGFTTTDKISFYGATPITQPTSSAQAAVTATSVSPASNAGGAVTTWGYTSQAQANAIPTLLNEIRAQMVALGLIKGS